MNRATANVKSSTGRWWIGPPNSVNLKIYIKRDWNGVLSHYNKLANLWLESKNKQYIYDIPATPSLCPYCGFVRFVGRECITIKTIACVYLSAEERKGKEFFRQLKNFSHKIELDFKKKKNFKKRLIWGTFSLKLRGKKMQRNTN